jgi:protocatechuate 3,4-dioxygenase beta subunit
MSPSTQIIEPNDDDPVGRVLTRREVLVLLAGLGGAALLAACDPLASGSATPTIAPTQTTSASGQPAAASTQTPLNAEAATAVAATPVEASPTANAAAVPDCVVRPELTEGPYFVDEKLNRSDIRSDPSDNSVGPGVPLALAFVVSQVGTGSCTPLKGAMVDVWHCDALGVYSDVQGSTGKKFLRGYQLTGANGSAKFTTIYPGWYQGRTVHIHFKIRSTGTSGAAYEFTSQLFFDDAISNQVYAQQPYSQHSGRDTLNSADSIYQGGGSQLLLNLTKSGDGYTATFPIGLDLSNTQVGASDSQQGGPGGPGGPAPATP